MKKILKRLILLFLIVLIILVGGFYVYTLDYYRTDPSVSSEMATNTHLQVNGRVTTFMPDNPNGVGLIFYPGGKVEYSAYYEILEGIRQSGVTVYLVKMPFNLAVFNINAADSIIEDEDQIESWLIMGHSLGGAMASSYASDHQDQIDGLILLGAYIYGDFPVDRTLTIYGEFDELAKENITYSENVFMIPGGNHAHFGNYGIQEGDGTATISSDDQQGLALNYIFDFISGLTSSQ